MDVMTEHRTSGRVGAASVLAVQAALTGLAGLGAIAHGARHPGTGSVAAGVVLLAVALAMTVVAAAIGRSRAWATPGALCVEVMLGLTSLAALRSRPALALIGLALELTVIFLLARRPRTDRPRPPKQAARMVNPVAAPMAAPNAPPAPSVVQPRISASQALLGLVTLAIFLVALALRGGLVFGMVVLAAIFIPIERVFAVHPQRILRKGWATDVVHFVVNNLLSTAGVFVAVVAVGAGLRALVPAALRASIAHQPGALQLVEALLLSELCFYGAHRATHTVPFLWKLHRVHHSIQEMDWLASARLHPIDQAFTRSCTVIPLFVLGFSKATFGGYLFFTTFQALFIHANVRLNLGPLRWVVATPEFHHWHHANDPEHYNTNFAGEFPWVDALFGTAYLDRGRFPDRYGIDDPVPSGYLRQLAWPFRG